MQLTVWKIGLSKDTAYAALRCHDSSHISKVSIKETIQYIKDRTENFDDYFSFM
jgi:hypothetical protein